MTVKARWYRSADPVSPILGLQDDSSNYHKIGAVIHRSAPTRLPNLSYGCANPSKASRAEA